MVGQLIEPYPLKIASRESKHPRFYYFDCGVARAAQGIQKIEEIPEQRGFFLETIILNELRTYFEVRRKNFKIFYYSISSVGDLDFIVEIKKKTISAPAQFVGIEIKFSKTWKTEFEKILIKIKAERSQQMVKSIGLYLGDQRLTRGDIEIYPLHVFVDLLWKDKII